MKGLKNHYGYKWEGMIVHMADALISPVTGGIMWAVSAGFAAYSANRLKKDSDDSKIPLMGVMGAFVFAAQMINFSIPGTGSSGHIGGGMLLSALLGPFGGFLTMASVLLIQALFFGDGGLLAFGCNLSNMGIFTCFLAFPLIWRRVMRKGITPTRIWWGSVLSVVVALQLGAFSVVLETLASGKTELPFTAFVMLMQPIHLAIGLVEGVVTAAILTFVWRARPELLAADGRRLPAGISIKKVMIAFGIAILIAGGALSLLSSSDPDGLEWSMFHVMGEKELVTEDAIHEVFAAVREKTVLLPDYAFKTSKAMTAEGPETATMAGTSVSGIVGGALTLLLAGLTGFFVTWRRKRGKNARTP
jgi:cobalt/nickel transport system permease protein